jgi:hypothetical protein
VTYREVDLGRVTTIPVAGRHNKVDQRLLASPPGSDHSFAAFLNSLPDVLAARDLRLVVQAVAAAKRDGRAVILLLGGHVVKVGLGPLVVTWLTRGIVTHVAMNGAAAIHDFELAAFGGTSEEVEEGLADGSFGMSEETGSEMNRAIAVAAGKNQGMGEGLCRALAGQRDLPGGDASILLAAQRLEVPVTVHAAALPDLDHGGVVLNWGSAVLMPEVFLKALTIARNLNQGRPTHFTAADFDMQRHYRPRLNVVQRPTRDGGAGFLLTGHHEILIPLLVWGVLEEL